MKYYLLYIYNTLFLLLFVLLLLKPAERAHAGKTTLFINCFRNPTKLKKAQLREATKG